MENRIEDLNANRAILTFLVKKETRKAGLALVKTIASKFFLPQFSSKLKIKKKTIINIDHTLDALIPFSSKYLKTYMGFTHLWIKSIYFVYRESGKDSLPFICRFIGGIEQLYETGAAVYDSCQSTTTRPKPGKNIPLKLIHMADPHLNCLPSLHVMIVCYTFIKISGFLDTLSPDPGKYRKEKAYLFSAAVQIIDSVLFMKQHSVNCIPAGFFALRSAINDFPEDLPSKITDQMLNTSSIPRHSGEAIKHYMTELYNSFLTESTHLTGTEILVDFLRNYRQTG